jgi:DNA processing protein
VAALREEAGVGPVTFWRLLGRFGSAESALAASEADLRAVARVGADGARRIAEAARLLPAVRRRLADLRSSGISPVTAFDPGYPSRLRRLPDAPPLLYALGLPLTWDAPCVAMVGAHRASSSGIRVARDWALALAARGAVVVSGLAAGIDAAAHLGSLDAGGPTAAVVGSGLDRIGPLDNLPLSRRIVGAGTILAEYPRGTPTSVGRLLARNRIVVGMSDAVLVVEARLNASGTMDAARRALKAGIPLFAVRDPEAFPGNEALLGHGARSVPPVPDPDALLSFLSP